MNKRTYAGTLVDADKAYVGMIHKCDGGYIVRKPDGRTIGKPMFDGHVFSGKDFIKVGSTDLGYATERYYILKQESDKALAPAWERNNSRDTRKCTGR